MNTRGKESCLGQYCTDIHDKLIYILLGVFLSNSLNKIGRAILRGLYFAFQTNAMW